MSAVDEIALQLDDVIRQATAMRAVIDSGELPWLADARVLRGQAVCAERLIELAHLEKLKGTTERTAAEDKAAQRVVESGRDEAGITGLLDDTESMLSGARDNRESAA